MKFPRYLMPALLIAPVACALIVAPSAAANCNASGDTLVCGQGHVRGGSGRAPVNHSASPDASQECRWACNDQLFIQSELPQRVTAREG